MLLQSLSMILATAVSQGVAISGTTAASPSRGTVVSIVDCEAFRANEDQSWTSIRPTTLGSVTLTEGGTFFPGVQLDGVDVVASLDNACRGRNDAQKGTRNQR